MCVWYDGKAAAAIFNDTSLSLLFWFNGRRKEMQGKDTTAATRLSLPSRTDRKGDTHMHTHAHTHTHKEKAGRKRAFVVRVRKRVSRQLDPLHTAVSGAQG